MRIGFLFALLAAGSAFSQGARVGLGAHLDKNMVFLDGNGSAQSGLMFDLFPASFATFSIPILIGEKVRVEPEIGYFRTGTTVDQDLGDDLESSTSIWQLALSISGGRRVDNLLYQFGVRTGITRQSASFDDGESDEESSQMNFHIGPILGAEYFFHPSMSVGAQVGFSYINIGEEDTEDDSEFPADEPEISQSMFSNNAKISLRWYY